MFLSQRHLIVLLYFTIVTCPSPCLAQNINVSGTSNITLAGQPAGTSCCVYGDRSPSNSPVQVPGDINAGQVITFESTGLIGGYNGEQGPDGNLFEMTGTAPSFGLSSVHGPRGALVGVFLGPDIPIGGYPPGLNFEAGARELETLRPLLQQPFYIGSGRTIAGASRNIVVPKDATRLFLGILNYFCSLNTGFFSVSVSVVQGPPPPSSVFPNVYGISNIVLAGEPDGVAAFDLDSSPLNSPVQVPFDVVEGQIVTVSASGIVTVSLVEGVPADRRRVSPDGDLLTTTFSSIKFGRGISQVRGPAGALIAVFLGTGPPLLATPDILDFSGTARDLTSLNPELQQSFYIGSGVVSTGARREILVPRGATRLFLGILSSPCSGNAGSFNVTVSVRDSLLAPVITSISPRQVIIGQTTALKVIGSNFQSGFRAEITTPAGTFPVLDQDARRFISGNNIEVDVLVGSTPSAPYNAMLRITNLGGQSTSTSFEVIAAGGTGGVPQVLPPGPKQSKQVMSDAPLNPDYPTIVLTHGLEPSDEPIEKLWSGFGEKQAGRLIRLSLDEKGIRKVNILQYVWTDAFQPHFPVGRLRLPTAEGYLKARSFALDAGKTLAKELLDRLDEGYSQPIHFIGHSLGTVVNTYAARDFLQARAQVRDAQFTALDRPDHVGDIPGVDETLDGFDENFFALNLPIGRQDLNLRVDNYYSLEGAGVGDKATGPVYNHDWPTGLIEPNDVGGRLFEEENVYGIDNNHTGVQQWYRWTVNPVDVPFPYGITVCNGENFADGAKPFSFDPSLNPCEKGWYWSVIHNPSGFPKGNDSQVTSSASSGLLFAQSSGVGCNLEKVGSVIRITCGQGVSSAHFLSAQVAQDTAYYLSTSVQIPPDGEALSFNYKFSNATDSDYAAVLIDDQPLWILSASSAVDGQTSDSGQIPVRSFRGNRKLTVVLYKAPHCCPK